jgi:predicted phosphodiesterase
VRYLILSDIHANLEALEAVLADADGCYDRIICTGDLVDYGADPNAVAGWARRSTTVIVRGNHDRVCARLDGIEGFSPAARAAALWTQNALTPENLEYLRGLPRGPLSIGDFQIMHGSPADEDEYLVSISDVYDLGACLERRLSFFGHTHLQGGFLWRGANVAAIGQTPADAGELVFRVSEGCFSMINPGSVGQPRDGDPRAAYLLYSPEEPVFFYRRVVYNVKEAQRKILAASLPPQLAARLAVGA